MLLHRLGERAEDDPHLLQLFLEGGGHRDAVEHRVHRHAGQQLPLFQWDAELLVGLQQLRIHLVQALGAVFLALGRGVINDVLVVDGRVVDVRPGGLLHGQPVPVGLEAPFQQPLRLVLLGRNQADDVLVQAAGDGIGFDVGDEPPLIFLIRKGFDGVGGIAHRVTLLSSWPVIRLANLYFLVKIAHLMDAERGRTASGGSKRRLDAETQRRREIGRQSSRRLCVKLRKNPASITNFSLPRPAISKDTEAKGESAVGKKRPQGLAGHGAHGALDAASGQRPL